MQTFETPFGGTAAPEWKKWLESRLLVVGSVLVLAACVYFFAWNWQHLSVAFRFVLVQGLFVLSVAVALWARYKGATLSAQLALTSACVLIGLFWAVFGQIYQTGADAWQLFALWSLCVLPWLATGFTTPLWLLWLIVSNLALCLWSMQEYALSGTLSARSRSLFFCDLTEPLLFSFLAWGACLLASRKRDIYSRQERAAAAFVLFCATQIVCLYLLHGLGEYSFAVSYSALFGLAALGLVLYRALQRLDLFCLHLLSLCGYLLLNCLLVKLASANIFSEFVSLALLFAAANIGYTAFLIKTLPRPHLQGFKSAVFHLGTPNSRVSAPTMPNPSQASEPAKFAGQTDVPVPPDLLDQTQKGGSLGRAFLLGTGGVLSGLTLALLFSAIFISSLQSESTLLTGGIVALISSSAISRRAPGPFRHMFGFSLSLAGLALTLAGLWLMFNPYGLSRDTSFDLTSGVLCATVYLAVRQAGTRIVCAVLFWFFIARAGLLLLAPQEIPFDLLASPTAQMSSAALFLRVWLGLCSLALAIRIWRVDIPQLLNPAITAALVILFQFQILYLMGNLAPLSPLWWLHILREALREAITPQYMHLATRMVLPFWGLLLLAFAIVVLLPRVQRTINLVVWRRGLMLACAFALLCLPFHESAVILLCLLALRAGAEKWSAVEAALFIIFLGAVLQYCPTGVLFALCLLLLGHLRRTRITSLAGWLWLTVFLFEWYYFLHLPFAYKAVATGTTGAVLLAGALLVRYADRLPGQKTPPLAPDTEINAKEGNACPSAAASPTDVTSPATSSSHTSGRLGILSAWRPALPLLLGVLCLASFNWAVFDKERLLTAGEEILLKLAPLDPRSLMQGDYMEFSFQLSDDLRNELRTVLRNRGRNTAQDNKPLPNEGYAIVRKNELNVGELVEMRFEPGTLLPGEIALSFRVVDAAPRLPKSFLFQEGLERLYSGAAYGIFRCTKDGICLLTGLADKAGRPIQPPATENL